MMFISLFAIPKGDIKERAMMRLCREFYFDAAHYLPQYKGKCEKLHGHTYKLEVVVEGDIQSDGMIIDFSKLKNIVEKEIINELDHRSLNELFEHPTAEYIVEWIATQLEGKLSLSSIKLWEGQGKWIEKVFE
jgi:6-pyruvoyltetrahydropterin/6-carboxytetrahydropterin synthase